MNAHIIDSLRRVDMFIGLSDEELLEVAAICRVDRALPGTVIFEEGEDSHDLYIILNGCVRVAINTRSHDGTVAPGTINMLYAGQSFGEMALLGGASRSATISSAETCSLLILGQTEFAALCDDHPRIGFVVMRNLASDLAYKLRSSNLLLRGNIRWQHGELGKR